MMLKLDRAALATVLLGVASALPGRVATVLAGVPEAALLVIPSCALGAGCRNSDGVRMHSHASRAAPPMRAQREAGRARALVTNFSQADL